MSDLPESEQSETSEEIKPSVVEAVVIAELPASAGQLLRAARLASGVHIGALSMTLKVPVKKLEALEADDWNQLPDTTFVRALIASVCRQIKTDSAPILAAIPKSTIEQIDVDAVSASSRPNRVVLPTESVPLLSRFPFSMPLLVGALVILLAAVILLFLPSLNKQKEAVALATSAPGTPLVQSSITPADVLSVPKAVDATAAVSESVVAAALAPQAPHVALPANDWPALKIVAKGTVWVQIKDSKDVILVQRTLQPQETVSASGTAPLAVIVGRIDEVESVTVRGKPFSLENLSVDNVARFEVN